MNQAMYLEFIAGDVTEFEQEQAYKLELAQTEQREYEQVMSSSFEFDSYERDSDFDPIVMSDGVPF